MTWKTHGQRPSQTIPLMFLRGKRLTPENTNEAGEICGRVKPQTTCGRSIPNFALFAGNAAGAALTVTCSPAQNTTFSQVTRTFGTSLAGSAFGFTVDEFLIDALVDLHLKKKQPQP